MRKKRGGKKMAINTALANTLLKQPKATDKRLTAKELVKRNASRDFAGKTLESIYKEGK